jgi:phosphoribosylformylglycinamidine cyclo-ligase
MSYQQTESIALSQIKKAIPSSLKSNLIKKTKGLFTELYESKIFPGHYLACSIDGVGTKLLIATALDSFDTIGIDLVAVCANDLATLGKVQPFLFMDYLAVQSKIELRVGEIINGVSKGLEICNTSGIFQNDVKINFGKGETASIDELLHSFKDGYGFDIAGAMIGFLPKGYILKEIKNGDKIIALKSSGLHSNGYTDARRFLLNGDFESRKNVKRLYKGGYSLKDKIGAKTIGELLLEPTKVYTRVIAEIANNFKILGVNNTGYGLKNFNRFQENVEFIIDNPMHPQEIFKVIQKESGFSNEEMYYTFNMGMGFFIIADEKDVKKILDTLKGLNEIAQVVGYVRNSNRLRTVLVKDNKRIVFEGYS